MGGKITSPHVKVIGRPALHDNTPIDGEIHSPQLPTTRREKSTVAYFTGGQLVDSTMSGWEGLSQLAKEILAKNLTAGTPDGFMMTTPDGTTFRFGKDLPTFGHDTIRVESPVIAFDDGSTIEPMHDSEILTIRKASQGKER